MVSAQQTQPTAGNKPPSVAIVGGGITGLVCAFRLVQRGVPVTLYEASDRVGGVIRSLHRDGYLAEFGPNSILETSAKITSLILRPRTATSCAGDARCPCPRRR